MKKKGKMFYPETRPANLDKPVLHVLHSKLERTDTSIFRSICPTCKTGILLIRRNEDTLELLAEDNCIGCGQMFVYDDIEELKQKDGNASF